MKKLKDNIVLIGFMGVGKGTIARALASQINTFALDCDDMIESFANKKIKDIFNEDGEEAFRKAENKLSGFLAKCVKGAIISTGGGFYKASNIKNIGKIIYLKANFDYIINRLKNSPNSKKKFAKRPLLSNVKNAKKIFHERQDAYEKVADLIINVENKTTQEIIKEIKHFIKK